jgi:hypothetical protein
VRGSLVTLVVAIGLGSCRPPQSIDRLEDGTSTIRATGGANGSTRGTGGSKSSGEGTGGAADPGAGEADAAPMPEIDMAPAPLPVGQACTTNEGCASGACVDGLCCTSACGGACQACDVPGHEGTCTPVPPGQDPDDECAMQPAASCGLDGTCDGQGACARYPAGAECIPGSCAAGVEHAGGACNGLGMCLPGSTQPCMSGVCNGSSCGAACTASTQCQPGFFCDAGSCRIKLAVAVACTMDAQCGSGHCVDRVCCATDCAQTSYACNLPGTAGSCTAIADGQDPAKECLAEAPATCGRAGGCNGRGGCKLHPVGTSCGAGSCTDAVQTAAKTCNGVGMCQGGATKSCGAFVCKGTACATSCAADKDCKEGLVCNDSACVMPPPAPVSKLDGLKVNDAANADGWSKQKDFQVGSDGAHPWTDWPNSYVASMDAPASVVLGGDWVKVAAESKKYAGGPQAVLTLKADADVYVAVDDRWGDKPAWLAGFTDTGWNLRVFESATKAFPFSWWVKKGPAGAFAVPAINDNKGYDYFIVVK